MKILTHVETKDMSGGDVIYIVIHETPSKARSDGQVAICQRKKKKYPPCGRFIALETPKVRTDKVLLTDQD